MNAKKTESGAELLARLHTRPNIKYVDSFIFGDSSHSSSGQLVEIFGPEGVAKTELSLHCAAKACLPASSKGLNLNGLGAKVIFIDTEYKFSILRLAVILEKQIQLVLSALNNKKKAKADKSKHDDGMTSCDLSVQPKGSEVHTRDKQTDNSESLNECTTEDLTNSDLEEIIDESLKNVQILKVSNSQQLLASLLSLENSIAEDPLYTLLIIDSISAFYWMDKLVDVDSTGRKMTHISDVISRLISDFGLTCLATSSAFFSGNNLPFKRKRDMVNDKSGKRSWMNSEYLGKSWMSLRTKRIYLSESEFVEDGDGGIEERQNKNGDDKTIHAFCGLTGKKKCYAFQEDFLKAV